MSRIDIILKDHAFIVAWELADMSTKPMTCVKQKVEKGENNTS